MKRYENTFTIKCGRDLGALELANCLESLGNKVGVIAISHHKNFSNYEKGFNILMDYFDEIAEEDRKEVDRLLKKVGL